jgi:type VI secretion system secreted protein Hcp
MAQVDYFLKIDGIEGESTDSKHGKEIDILSWSWGESNAGSHDSKGGGGAGKVVMQDLHCVAQISKASHNLFLSCASGKHIPKAVLVCRKAGEKQQEFLTITFSDLLVSTYQTGGSQGDVIPTDQFALNFAKIEIDYKAQDEKGGLGGSNKAGWDLKKNAKV